MAWNKVSRGGFLIASETLTLPTGAATDSPTSVIDWIPRGRGFWTIVNTGATDLANAATTDIQGAVSAAPVGWVEIAEGYAADCDASAQTDKFRPKRDDVAIATAPRYRLVLKHAGNQTGESVTVVVVVDLSDSDCTSK
jgi:hypothetical protein